MQCNAALAASTGCSVEMVSLFLHNLGHKKSGCQDKLFSRDVIAELFTIPPPKGGASLEDDL